MSSRQGGKGTSNNIDRIYNQTPWLSFSQEQTEKRFTLEYLQRQRYSYIGIVAFNVFHIVYGFLTITSLTQVLYPILSWLMILSLLLSFRIMYMQYHNQYIDKNYLFQFLIRLSSFYFYCSQYLSVDHLEMGKTATLFMSSALAISIHMVFTNMLTIPHWKNHLIINFVTFTAIQFVVLLASLDSMIQFNLLFFILAQASLNIFAGFFEKFIREMWIHLDMSKKQTAQLQNVIDEIPQPLLVVDTNCNVLLSNFAAPKFFQSILPAQEPEGGNIRNTNNPSKILHRLCPEDLKVIESLILQVKESEKICKVIFQKKNLPAVEQEQIKPVELAFVGSCEAEKTIEKEIEKNIQAKTTIQYKYNEKPTFIVMDDSSLVMTNISFMKYEIPKVLETCTSGEAVYDKYINSLKNNTLYNFIIMGTKIKTGTNGNDIMLRIRQHEKDNNLPRTYLIALFNSISDDIGGQTFNKDSFIFIGFDDAIEKPLKADVMNALLKSRATPPLIFTKKDEYSIKFKYFDKFSILACDEADQISLNLSGIEIENVERPIFTWNGQSLLDKYLSAAIGGKLFSFIFTGIRPVDLKKDDVIKAIRQYEKVQNIPKTYIIGFMRMNQTGSPSVNELIQEGYNEIVDCNIDQEGIVKIITRLRLTLNLQQKQPICD